MPAFTYTGRTRSGAPISGEMEAPDREAVIAQLRKQNIMTTAVKPKSRNIQIKLPFGNKVKEKTVGIFTRQFATMIDAGLPLVQCLEILGTQQDNKVFQQVIFQLRTDVEGGSTYAAALRKHPRVFSELYANMVEAGEAGGILDTILNRLATYIEKAASLKSKVKGAMIYPIAILVVAMAVVLILLLFAIPTFAKMFKEMGVPLPLPTRIVIALSNLLRATWYLMLGGFIGAFFGFRILYQRRKFRKQVHAVLLKVPLFGNLLRKVAVAKFTRTLGTLISSGVPILDGLDITARTAGNLVVEEAIMKTRASISEGKTISEPLKATGIFPPMVVQMIGVGEQTGALDSMLNKIADFYDEEVDTAVSNLTAMIEPVFIVVLGGIVGGVAVAMYLPIFKIVTMAH